MYIYMSISYRSIICLDINVLDEEGNSGLHLAVLNGQKEAVRLLLLRGCSSHILNSEHMGALHLAVRQNKPDIIEVSLYSGLKCMLKLAYIQG